MKQYIFLIILFIISIVLVIIIPDNTDYVKTSKLFINEIMSKNTNTIKDNFDEYSDYIEIYNESSNDINLEGYHLSDSEFKTSKWTFPSITIKANSYLLVFATGKDICDLDNNICHTNFKLNSEGEVLTLTDDMANIISKVKYNKMYNDISFGYYNNKYILMKNPTPGFENDKVVYKDRYQKVNLIINEYMTHNKNSLYLPNGNYYDWVEVYNPSSNDISLEGIYITDNKDNLEKFKLPNEVIKAGDYKVIYFTGNDNVDGYICVNFKLSDNENIILSSGGKIIDSIDITTLYDDVSYGIVNDEWKYFLTPTPGKKNDTHYISSLGDLNGNS